MRPYHHSARAVLKSRCVWDVEQKFCQKDGCADFSKTREEGRGSVANYDSSG